jgi:hypothetical protein
MELEKTVAEIKVYGESVKLTLPSVSMWEEYQEVMKAGELSEFKASQDFLVKCGMPSELVKELELAHIGKLINFLSGVKKN